MLVIPAIDLMQGRVVRLIRGDPATAKYYEQWGTPIQVALKWKGEGAKRLHIIDLDAALGKGDNTRIVANIVQAAGLPVQVGGGIRTIDTAEKLLSFDVKHIILGALAFSNPQVIAQLQRKFGVASVIVALDNKNGEVMVEGWKTRTSFTMSEALEKFTTLGAKTFLITSITKDGMLQGPDLETLRQASEYEDVEIVAAGGIGSIDDLVALKEAGVEGVVVGKALYETRFTLKEALAAVEAD